MRGPISEYMVGGSLQAADMDPSMESIALANAALAAFETGDTTEAVRIARQLLRR